METSIAVAVEAAVIMADEVNTLAVEAEEVVATITEVKKTKKDVISQIRKQVIPPDEFH